MWEGEGDNENSSLQSQQESGCAEECEVNSPIT